MALFNRFLKRKTEPKPDVAAPDVKDSVHRLTPQTDPTAELSRQPLDETPPPPRPPTEPRTPPPPPVADKPAEAETDAEETSATAADAFSMSELDAILDTVEQIDDIIGDKTIETETAEVDITLPLWELLSLLPETARRVPAPAAATLKGRTVSLSVPDLLDQLARGEVRISLAALVAGMPADVRTDAPALDPQALVTLPLAAVVAAIPSEVLNGRGRAPQREIGLDHLPDPFSPKPIPPATQEVRPPTPAPQPSRPEPKPEAPLTPTAPAPIAAPAATQPVEEAPTAPKPVEPPAPAQPVELPVSEPVAVPPAPKPVEAPLPPLPIEAPKPPEPVVRVPFQPPLPQPQPAASVAASADKPPEAEAALPEVPADAPVIPVRGIDLNRATPRELCKRLPGIGPKTAQDILVARPFESVYALAEVPGIGKRQFFRITGEHLPPSGAAIEAIEKIMGPSTEPLPHMRDIAARIAEMSGVHGCLISHVDGHLLAAAKAGKAHQSFGAVAPQIMKSLEKYMELLRLEAPSSVTVFTDPKPFHITRYGNLFLIVSIPRTRFSIRRINLMENLVAEIVRRIRQHG